MNKPVKRIRKIVSVTMADDTIAVLDDVSRASRRSKSDIVEEGTRKELIAQMAVGYCKKSPKVLR